MHVPPPGIFQGNHALVIGSSMSGLLAARVLAAHFDRVTVYDRDTLPGMSENRLGVPQGRHGHGLLASGLNGLKRLFPALERELLDAGAIPGDVIGSVRWFQHGYYKARFQSGLDGLLLSRPLLETSVRRQVKHLPNVRIVDHHHVLGLLADNGRITGIRVQRDGGETSAVMADLIVDATGRSSRSPEWLESLGFPKPDVEEVRIDLGYTTRIFRRRAGDLSGDVGAILAPMPPNEMRVGFMLAMEGSRWIVTIGGWLGHHAPTDPKGFVEFARSLARPDIYNVIKDAEPLTDPVKFVFPSNLRRRYDKLARFPDNFLVMGDALCSFNPLYGQGMSVATLEALALDECLNRLSSPDRVWRPFFKAATKVIDTPWTIAAGSDFAFTGVTGPRPAGTSAVNWYLTRVHKAASIDQHVCRSFFDVANLLRPATTLFAPSVVARVARVCLAPTVPSRSTGVRLDSKGRLIETT
jgi:2-polyprenyl-6-methoxyphenol hydroxylase-like FAD-dependent oxidoreductase